MGIRGTEKIVGTGSTFQLLSMCWKETQLHPSSYSSLCWFPQEENMGAVTGREPKHIPAGLLVEVAGPKFRYFGRPSPQMK